MNYNLHKNGDSDLHTLIPWNGVHSTDNPRCVAKSERIPPTVRSFLRYHSLRSRVRDLVFTVRISSANEKKKKKRRLSKSLYCSLHHETTTNIKLQPCPA